MNQETENSSEEAILEAIGKLSDLGELVKNYVGLRDQKEEIKREMTDRTAPINAYMERIETRILELLKTSNMESVKTKFGTAYKTPKLSAKVADWKVFWQYVLNNNASDLLVKNVSKTAVKARIEQTGEIVPGIDLYTFESIGVRRS